jgi:type VI protein secretion system component Hcp
MKTIATAVLMLLASTTVLSAQNAASNAKRSPVEAACASNQTGKGEGKFTGQIYSAAASSFQVTSGKDMASVSYNNSLLVCEGGQLSSTSVLIPGATVEVIGTMAHQGTKYEFAATKVFVSPSASTNSALGNSANSNARVSTPVAANVVPSEDFAQNPIGSSARGNQQNNSAAVIACNSLQFEVTSAANPTGKAVQKPASTPITCRRNVDQESMTLLQDVMNGRRVASVSLSWQGTMVVALANAEVTNVTFTSDNTGQIVEIAFTAEKWEITHSPSGSKVASDSWTQH